MPKPTRLLTLLHPLSAAAIVMFAFAFWLGSARCEVSVQGTDAAVHINADQAPVSEVLSALGARFKVRHQTLIALDQIIVSGTYSGALEEVLRRVLAGLNYVIKIRGGVVEVIVVGGPGDVPAAVVNTPPGLPTNTNPAAQWRRAAPAE